MKPTKWGVKLFMLCCASTSYCIRFEIFTGKARADSNAISAFGVEGIKETLGAGLNTVLLNTKLLWNPLKPDGQRENKSFRVIYMDRFFTSITLFLALLTVGIYACGTVLTNRKGRGTCCLHGRIITD